MLRVLRISLVVLLWTLGMPSAAGPGQGPAPAFSLPGLDGAAHALADHRGKVVMVNFWASWCGPCRQEMPLLDALYQRYERLGFTLLGVNVEQDPAAARAWLAEVPVTFPVLFDADNSVSKAFAVDAMPSTVLIDRSGTVRLVHRGFTAGDEVAYLEAVRRLVREQ